MASGLDISKRFINESLLTALKEHFGADVERLAVSVVGTGSDVLGLDDVISRDHHWGPRANIMYARADEAELAPRIKSFLQNDVASEYDGFEVHIDLNSMTGVCTSSIEGFFEWFLGTSDMPETELDWLKLCPVDLLHVTAGEIVYDGLGEFTRRREAVAYYPDNVWKKLLADWCMYITGRDAPYNLHRVSKRGDELTSNIYFANYMKQLMEMAFLLNRQYPPYTKWLNRMVRRLPRYADQLVPGLDALVEESDWNARVMQMIELNYIVADALAELGLTKPPRRREFDEGLTDLTLYDSAAQIYGTLPPEFLVPSTNRIECWEKLARVVVMDANDYFQSSYESNS